MRSFKLKHLKYLTEDNLDNEQLIFDLSGYKNNWINKKFRAKKIISNVSSILEQIKNVDPLKCKLSTLCEIAIPDNIDDIPFISMIELYSTMDKDGDVNEMIGDVVTIACFSENVSGDFDTSNESFIKFREVVENSPVVDVFAIFNIIVEKLDESKKMWEKLFLQVNISDSDYDLAGGHSLDKFNVVNTVKTICSDFNVSYDRAWQLPYSLVQTNSLSKATQGKVQSELSKIKENKMKNKIR